MQRAQTRVTTPADFSFGFTVSSHGWERLAPFSLNREKQVLTRIERFPSQLVRLEIAYDGEIDVTGHSETTLNEGDKGYVAEFIAHCFSLNWDMSECYAKRERHRCGHRSLLCASVNTKVWSRDGKCRVAQMRKANYPSRLLSTIKNLLCLHEPTVTGGFCGLQTGVSRTIEPPSHFSR